MKGSRPDHGENVVPFRTRPRHGKDRNEDGRRDNVLRLLDLTKFERMRHASENDPSMRVNIAAMVLLGLLVFVAAEDFSRLELSNLCSYKIDCGNW